MPANDRVSETNEIDLEEHGKLTQVCRAWHRASLPRANRIDADVSLPGQLFLCPSPGSAEMLDRMHRWHLRRCTWDPLMVSGRSDRFGDLGPEPITFEDAPAPCSSQALRRQDSRLHTMVIPSRGCECRRGSPLEDAE